jgi:drug/metabolite transporter (DMT)-like permease
VWDVRRGTKQRFSRADAPKLLLVGLCGITFNQFFFIAGLSRTSVAHMAVFIALTPILVLLLAAAIGQERITIPKLAGMLVAMAGVLALEFSQENTAAATPLGDLYAFLGTAAFSIYTVAGKDLASRYGSIPMNLLCYSVGTVTLAPISWFARSSFHFSQVSAAAWGSLAYMVIFASILAYLIYYYALVYVSASRVAAFTYAEPVMAAALGYVLLGEPVTWLLALAGVLVLAGVWVAERF